MVEYNRFEIEGNNAILYNKDGEIVGRIDLLTLIDEYLDEKGYKLVT